MRPRASSLLRYSETPGCSWADLMLAGADRRFPPRLKPIRKPWRRPLMIYCANALSGWACKANSHAGMTSGVDTVVSAGGREHTGGRQASRHRRSEV